MEESAPAPSSPHADEEMPPVSAAAPAEGESGSGASSPPPDAWAAILSFLDRPQEARQSALASLPSSDLIRLCMEASATALGRLSWYDGAGTAAVSGHPIRNPPPGQLVLRAHPVTKEPPPKAMAPSPAKATVEVKAMQHPPRHRTTTMRSRWLLRRPVLSRRVPLMSPVLRPLRARPPAPKHVNRIRFPEPPPKSCPTTRMTTRFGKMRGTDNLIRDIWLRTSIPGSMFVRTCLRCSAIRPGAPEKAGALISGSPPLPVLSTDRSGGRSRICSASAPENTRAGLSARSPRHRCLTSVSAGTARIRAPVSCPAPKATGVWDFVCVRSWPAKEPATRSMSAIIALRGADP